MSNVSAQHEADYCHLCITGFWADNVQWGIGLDVKLIVMQTTIFKQLAHNKAEAMLNHINEQRTGKEKFVLSCCADMGTLMLYMAVNEEKQYVFNILDDQGNTPRGMSANWRAWNHIQEDLK